MPIQLLRLPHLSPCRSRGGRSCKVRRRSRGGHGRSRRRWRAPRTCPRNGSRSEGRRQRVRRVIPRLLVTAQARVDRSQGVRADRTKPRQAPRQWRGQRPPRATNASTKSIPAASRSLRHGRRQRCARLCPMGRVLRASRLSSGLSPAPPHGRGNARRQRPPPRQARGSGRRCSSGIRCRLCGRKCGYGCRCAYRITFCVKYTTKTVVKCQGL